MLESSVTARRFGGLERLYNANIKKLGVIHRGFSTYEKTKYRNILHLAEVNLQSKVILHP